MDIDLETIEALNEIIEIDLKPDSCKPIFENLNITLIHAETNMLHGDNWFLTLNGNTYNTSKFRGKIKLPDCLHEAVISTYYLTQNLDLIKEILKGYIENYHET